MSFKRIVNSIQKLYPVKYSETAWDNPGLLLDTSSSLSSNPIKILLTIDLTKKVVQEAIEGDFKLIIAYHPFIFKGIKQITPQTNPQHDSLIKLIQNGISVYSPHTAIDSIKGGVNDWLIEGITSLDNVTQVDIISPNKTNPQVGVGRVVTLQQEVLLTNVISSLKRHLGVDNLLVSSHQLQDKKVKKVAICAGSGGSVFQNVADKDVDLYVTGELSHHEALFLKELDKSVIISNHSNTERGYLKRVLLDLEREIGEDEVKIVISKTDADAYEFV